MGQTPNMSKQNLAIPNRAHLSRGARFGSILRSNARFPPKAHPVSRSTKPTVEYVPVRSDSPESRMPSQRGRLLQHSANLCAFFHSAPEVPPNCWAHPTSSGRGNITHTLRKGDDFCSILRSNARFLGQGSCGTNPWARLIRHQQFCSTREPRRLNYRRGSPFARYLSESL